MIKEVYEWKRILTRPLGRPKNRWDDDIRKDMKKLNSKELLNAFLTVHHGLTIH